MTIRLDQSNLPTEPHPCLDPPMTDNPSAKLRHHDPVPDPDKQDIDDDEAKESTGINDPDAPARGVIYPEQDAPEPNEPG